MTTENKGVDIKEQTAKIIDLAKKWRLPAALLVLNGKRPAQAFDDLTDLVATTVKLRCWESLVNKESKYQRQHGGLFGETIVGLWIMMNDLGFITGSNGTPFGHARELLEKFAEAGRMGGPSVFEKVISEFMIYCFSLLEADSQKTPSQWHQFLSASQNQTRPLRECLEKVSKNLNPENAYWYICATESSKLANSVEDAVVPHLFRAFIYGSDSHPRSLLYWAKILHGPRFYRPHIFFTDPEKKLSFSEQAVEESCVKATERIVSFCKKTDEFVKACVEAKWTLFKVVAIERDLDLCIIKSVTLRVYRGHMDICDLGDDQKKWFIRDKAHSVLTKIAAFLKIHRLDFTKEVDVVFDVKPYTSPHEQPVEEEVHSDSFTLQVIDITPR